MTTLKDNIKNRTEHLKQEAKKKLLDLECWCINHKEIIAIATPIVIAGLKKTNKLRNEREEERHRNQTIYDRSEGHYWNLRRSPTQSEWGEINYRHRQGEPYYSILISMNLL